MLLRLSLSFFLHRFRSLSLVFPYFSLSLRIDTLRFQAGCRKRWLHLALVVVYFVNISLVHFFWLANACFCYVTCRFSFSIPDRLVERLRHDIFCVKWDVNPQLNNQSINHDVLTSVCLCWSRPPLKSAEPIDIPFGSWPKEQCIIRERTLAPAGEYDGLICAGAAM